MLTAARNPWGKLVLALAGLSFVLALGGPHLLGALLTPRGELGPDGRQLVGSLQALLAFDGLFLLLISSLLLDLQGLRQRVEQRLGQAWHFTVAALLYIVCAVTLLLLAKLVQDNTVRLEAANPFYQHGLLFGQAVLLPVEPFSIADFATSIFLVLAATTAYVGLVGSWRAPQPRRLLPVHLWAMMAAGLAYAGLDEYFTLHEFLGANTPLLRDVTWVEHPDDLVMGGYFLTALLVFVGHLRLLARSRLGLGLLLAGGLLQALAVAGDACGLEWMAEETLEALAAACYLLGTSHYLIVELAAPRAPRVSAAG
ncbi:MAG: hypothetical protein FJ125_06020 [Deltaproteobacteria bacterium]|nr:hypothetical protein [Deltaproteobacteria bacterium]